MAEAAAAQLRLDRAEQVVRLVRDREVRVARDPEARGSTISMPGKRRSTWPSMTSSSGTRRSSAFRNRGSRGGTLIRAKRRLAGHRVAHAQAEVERQPGDVGERQPRADGQRGQHRVDLAVELRVDLLALGRAQVAERGDLDARLRQRGADLLGPDAALLGGQLAHALGDALEHLLAGHLVGRRRRPARLEGVLDGRHAHHEELVEVAGEDREELAPLQQRLRPCRARARARGR